MIIKFSPPDISQTEIDEVVNTLKSGWITTGPKTKKFEQEIADYCGVNKAVCLNSATACLEMALRYLGIKEGDEVITSAYTYTASASVIDHIGAKIVLVDVAKDTYFFDLNKLEKAITSKTKAIITVDIGGVLSDYTNLYKLIDSKKSLFRANNNIQKIFDRIVLISDAAHSFGAKIDKVISGNFADFTSFSFHAVKNLTTGEGGALTWKNDRCLDDLDIYKFMMNMSLHGQTKDALSKNQKKQNEKKIILNYLLSVWIKILKICIYIYHANYKIKKYVYCKRL